VRVIFRLGGGRFCCGYPVTLGRRFCVAGDVCIAQFFSVPEIYILGSVSLGSTRTPGEFVVGRVYTFCKLLPVNVAELATENI